MAFVDESGSVSADRFFAVGCLKLTEPSDLLRPLHRLRERPHWYKELHFTELTRNGLDFHRAVISSFLDGCRTSCVNVEIYQDARASGVAYAASR